ncbi:MAG: alkaline phosphatase [Candidatus Sumerlaeia bacterium]|nr:alkaline phosphatase [Candidatus Sumerlaeia bacterium]
MTHRPSTPGNTSRRQFLSLSALGIGSGALLATSPNLLVAETAASIARTNSGKKRPQKIIFLVSDGMSHGVIGLAELMSLQVRRKGTYFAELLRNRAASKGFFETHSLDSFVPDSAAAGSAWGSGSRVMNGALNMFPDGTSLVPIFELAREAGWGTGIATTVTVTHATPASFIVSHPTRGEEQEIAVKYLNAADVILGGGFSRFKEDSRPDGRNLEGEFIQAGYKVVDTRQGLLELTPADKKILGTFDRGALPYTVDQMANPDWVSAIPTLAEMTAKALESLEENHSSGWMLQVEGARVDHAAHTNDAAGLLWDQLAFDDAIGVCLEFAAKHPETLIVVTSDHGNANPGLSYNGSGTNAMLEKVGHAKGTTHAVRAALNPHANNPADIHDVIRDILQIDISKEHSEHVSRMLQNDFDMVVNRQLRNFNGAFNSLISNYNGVSWISTQHTEDYTVIAAIGPGQEHFGSLIKNTEAFRIMADFIGSGHQNPVMTLEDAREHASISGVTHFPIDQFHT